MNEYWGPLNRSNMLTILLIVGVAGTAAEVVYKAKSISSIDWQQIPQNDDKIYHQWNLKQDGSMEVLAHSRSLNACADNARKERETKGFIGNMQETKSKLNRKLKQISSSESIQLQAIIGTDDRFKVEDTVPFPYSAIGLLMFKDARTGGTGICTGTMISRYSVITSAHCIWDLRSEVANSDFRFYPARNGGVKPYDKQEWSNIAIPQEWTVNRNQEFDYAVIQLQQPIGDFTGWLGFNYQCGYDLNNSTELFRLIGYPMDKENEQWQVVCTIESFDPCDAFVSEPIFHTCDTLSGVSGGALWKVVHGRYASIRGIHQGYAALTGNRFNKAIAIDQYAYDFLVRNLTP